MREYLLWNFFSDSEFLNLNYLILKNECYNNHHFKKKEHIIFDLKLK